MARIFISYRRDGSGGWAGRLDDWLSRHFGRDNVFMDINTIEPGLDFVEVIEQAVGQCDALIALIGKQWLTLSDDTGRRRLDNPEDFVRLEIAAALARNIRVIPVLVEGALMPRSTDLPDVLKLLARRNAHEISDRRFPYDVDQLIEVLDKVMTQFGFPVGPITLLVIRRTLRSRALSSVQPANCGRNTFLTSCCVIVLVAAIRPLSLVRLATIAPTRRIGSTPGW